VTDHSRQKQAGSTFGNKTVLNEGRGKRRRRAGDDVIAMEHHGGTDANGDAVDRGNDRLPVVDERLKEDDGVSRPRHVVFCRRGLQKSPMSLPAVNTPERPVRIKQRMAGLDCAESIASLMARYISCVNVFFFFRTPPS